MPALSRRRLAWILLFLSPAFFGVNMLMARYATFVPPNALALGRWLLVTLILLPFVWPRLVRHRHALAREWPDLLMLGAIGMWIEANAYKIAGPCREVFLEPITGPPGFAGALVEIQFPVRRAA